MRVTLLAAQSLDGFITRHATPGTAFTSPADKAWFPRVMAGFDCSVMGSVTYQVSRDVIRPHLSAARRRIVLTRHPAEWSADAVPTQLEFTAESPAVLISRLAALGHRHCALLGGSQIHSLFFAAGLVDELWITLEPRVFGSGTPFVAAPADIDLRLLSHEHLAGDTLLLKYTVAR